MLIKNFLIVSAENNLAKSGWVPQMFKLSDDVEAAAPQINSKVDTSRPSQTHHQKAISDFSIMSMEKSDGITVSVAVDTTTDSPVKPAHRTHSRQQSRSEAEQADLDDAEKWILEVEKRRLERQQEREAAERFKRGEDKIWVGPRRGVESESK